MFIDSSRPDDVFTSALMYCVIDRVIDSDAYRMLNDRAARDATLHAVLSGAHAALCATNNHTDFRETVTMLCELLRADADAEVPPPQLDAELLADARRIDAELTRAALAVFAQTDDLPDLIDTLVRVCAVHDAPVVANRRRVLADQALLQRGDLSFLALSDSELETRMAAAQLRRHEQRHAFKSWFAGAPVPCPFDVVATELHAKPIAPAVNIDGNADNDDDDDNDNDNNDNAEFRSLLALRAADQRAHADLLGAYETERRLQHAKLQFMHTPSLLSFEENRFLAAQ